MVQWWTDVQAYHLLCGTKTIEVYSDYKINIRGKYILTEVFCVPSVYLISNKALVPEVHKFAEISVLEGVSNLAPTIVTKKTDC